MSLVCGGNTMVCGWNEVGDVLCQVSSRPFCTRPFWRMPKRRDQMTSTMAPRNLQWRKCRSDVNPIWQNPVGAWPHLCSALWKIYAVNKGWRLTGILASQWTGSPLPRALRQQRCHYRLYSLTESLIELLCQQAFLACQYNLAFQDHFCTEQRLNDKVNARVKATIKKTLYNSESLRRLWPSEIPCWKSFRASFELENSSPIFRQHQMLPLPRFGHFRHEKWLLENWPRLRERSWMFSSETATAFCSSSEQ